MTTAEQLRHAAGSHTDYANVATVLLHNASFELDQRDDTIAQLRAERDGVARERDKLREFLVNIEWSRSECGCDDNFCHWCHGHKPNHAASCVLAAALKGETK